MAIVCAAGSEIKIKKMRMYKLMFVLAALLMTGAFVIEFAGKKPKSKRDETIAWTFFSSSIVLTLLGSRMQYLDDRNKHT